MCKHAFEKAMDVIFRWEGGYVDNPKDPGGETKYGICKRSYPKLDIKKLTKTQAKAIYKEDYWDAIKADELSPALGLAAFDCAVNQGVSRSKGFLKQTDHYAEFMALRMQHYISLKDTWKHFGRGWMNRLSDVLKAAAKLDAESQTAPVKVSKTASKAKKNVSVKVQEKSAEEEHQDDKTWMSLLTDVIIKTSDSIQDSKKSR